MSWNNLTRSAERAASTEIKPKSKASAVAAMVGISALAGVIVAAITVPVMSFATKTATDMGNDMLDLPLALEELPNPQTTRLLASNGDRIAYFYQENRDDITLDVIAPVMKEAILAIEDYRFYEHGAMDLKGTLRAAMNNAADGQTQGGSTITQQLVKLSLVQQATTPEQQAAATKTSMARKIRELKIAIDWEEKYSKDELLEKYLNIAYFGDGAYGINAAAYHFFSVSPDKLSVAQAATLAGLVKNPDQFNPRLYPERALQRRNIVLNRMAELGKIKEAEAEKLSSSQLNLKLTKFPNGCVESVASFSCDYARRYLLQEEALGETVEERQALLERGGLTIKSNIDLRMQKAVNKAVNSKVAPTNKAVGVMALVEPGTGKVRAIGQSRPMGRNKKKGQTFINFAVPKQYGDANGFQGGSTFKMFTVAAALEEGIPTSRAYNSPNNMVIPAGTYFDCDGNGIGPWTLKNSTGQGYFDMVQGTRQSVNTYFAQLERDVGLCKTVKMGNKMGIPIVDYDKVTGSSGSWSATYTLGHQEVSPLEIAAAYATPAAGGKYCTPAPISEILDQNGKVIKKYRTDCKQVMSKDSAAKVNAILAGVQLPGGFGYNNGTGLNIPSAAKTGTTDKSKAVWYAGYTPEISAASVIAGLNDKGQPRGLVDTELRGGIVRFSQAGGSSLAGPQWKVAMGEIQKFLAPVPFDSTTLDRYTPPAKKDAKPDKKKKDDDD